MSAREREEQDAATFPGENAAEESQRRYEQTKQDLERSIEEELRTRRESDLSSRDS
jgi:hypothetical protein